MNRTCTLSTYPQPQPNTLTSPRRFPMDVQIAALCGLLIPASFGMHAQTVQPSPASDGRPDLSAYVSKDLDPGEQLAMRAMMESLPLEEQKDLASRPPESVHIAFVDGGSGLIHYNHAEDVGSYEVRPNPGMPGDAPPFSEDSGLDPGLYAGSGPYRRVYTKPMPGLPQPKPTEANDLIHQHFYATIGDVSIACNAGSFAGEDIGYSYMGGWSGTWNSLSGTEAKGRAIDAGLQYSPKYNNYALIMAIAGVGIITQGNYSGASTPPRIQCTPKNDWAEIHFSAFGAFQTPTFAPTCWKFDNVAHRYDFIGFPSEGCNTYGLELSVGSSHFVGHAGAIAVYKLIWYSPNYEYGGWGSLEPLTVKYYNGQKNVSGWLPRVSCANCAFKWMTSIAQKKENLTDGSSYAAAWAGHFIYKWGMESTASEVPAGDLYCTEYPLWESAYPTKHAQDCRKSPTGLKGVQQSIAVPQYSSQFETDVINLKY